jgi:hypothetical protein
VGGEHLYKRILVKVYLNVTLGSNLGNSGGERPYGQCSSPDPGTHIDGPLWSWTTWNFVHTPDNSKFEI